MARKFWVVFADDLGDIFEADRGAIRPTETNRNFGIFYREDLANDFAMRVSRANPGSEVQVAEAVRGYHSPPPIKITEKVWTKDGEYVLP